MNALTVLLWGRAEYERHVSALTDLSVTVIEHAGDDAPLEDADVIVVPIALLVGCSAPPNR